MLGGQVLEVSLRDAPNPLTLLAAGSAQGLAAAAEAEARAIVAEAEIAREDAVREGWNEGFQAGHAEATMALNDALNAAHRLTERIESYLEALPDRAGDEAAAVALEVAARIVRAEIAVRPERVLDVVRAAIRRATDRERLLIHVNPADLQICRDGAPELMTQMGGIMRIDVVDDPRIATGGCILETPTGDVDATLAGQLARIHEALSAPPDEELLGV
jgi:flagellar assembly protein FliH